MLQKKILKSILEKTQKRRRNKIRNYSEDKKPPPSKGGFFIPILEAKLRYYSVRAMRSAEFVYQK
jgi:hypothetical protein